MSALQGASRLLVYCCLISFASALVTTADELKSHRTDSKDEETILNSIGMKLKLLPPGEFMMGSPEAEKGRDRNEGPRHKVRITKPFYLGVYEVTQAEFQAIMGENPSFFSSSGEGREQVKGMNTNGLPVERVSWRDANEFCRKLSSRSVEKRAGRVYRLPTEAEWEYACRAGAETPFFGGKALSSELANFNGSYPYGGAAKGKWLERTTRVGSYKQNAFGFYDMDGNVAEWCADYYVADYYRKSPQQDPQGPKEEEAIIGHVGRHVACVVRGGSWFGGARFCRCAQRSGAWNAIQSPVIGFRVACNR